MAAALASFGCYISVAWVFLWLFPLLQHLLSLPKDQSPIGSSLLFPPPVKVIAIGYTAVCQRLSF